jgi:RND family efflux transporter MFP subunit
MISTSPSPENKKPSGHRLPLFILFIVFIALGIWGIVSRVAAEHALHNQTEANAIPSVTVMQAPAGPASEDVVLPGTVQAWHEAPIYARTNGYLKRWVVDIGAHVKTGDLLAEIDTPDVDAQLHQAEADLKTAQANNDLAQITLKRWQALFKTNSVSKQDLDDKAGAAAATEAQLASATANRDRLQQLEDFKMVTAPFDGVITMRNVDVGALVNAGAGTSSQQELFHIAETDKLRVYVEVPENYTAAITPDMQANLYFPAYPGRAFPATLATTANAIDPTTRTLLVQLQVDNTDGTLMSGGYAEAHLKLTASGANVRLPVNTLLFRNGIKAAVLGNDNHVTLKTITIGRDFGKSVEALAGVSPGETIVVNPPDDLANGEEVRVVTPQEQKKSDGEAGSKSNDDQKSNDGQNGGKDDSK